MAQRREKERNAKRSRAAILQAAERLFATKGYEATSLTDVGAAAGVSRGTPGYFFGSKAELYQAVLDRSFNEVREAGPALRTREENGAGIRIIPNRSRLSRAEPRSRRSCERSAGCRRGRCPQYARGEKKRSARCETRSARRQAGASPHPRALSRRSSLSSGRCRIAGRHGGRRFHSPSPQVLSRRRPPFISKRTNDRECRAGPG